MLRVRGPRRNLHHSQRHLARLAQSPLGSLSRAAGLQQLQQQLLRLHVVSKDKGIVLGQVCLAQAHLSPRDTPTSTLEPEPGGMLPWQTLGGVAAHEVMAGMCVEN